MRRILGMGLVTSALVCTGMVLAQAPEPQPPNEPAPSPAKAPTEVPAPGARLTDPTKPSPRVQAVLGPDKTGPKGTPAPRISALALRGRIIGRDRPPTALLEVEGRLYTVTKDSKVPGVGNTMIRVLELNADELRLEVSPQKEIIILR